jgi:hypothetical protein
MMNYEQSQFRKFEGMKPLGRLRHRWKDSIKIDLKRIGCEYVDWIRQALNRGQ